MTTRRRANICGHRYYVTRDGAAVVLTPHGSENWAQVARSDVDYSDYAYDHGGTIYRQAVDEAKRIAGQVAR